MGRILPFILVVQFVLLIALSTTSAWMPSRPPAELAARLELRVCPDTATTTPEMLLSGGELAGPAIAASTLQLVDFEDAQLEDVSEDAANRFFFDVVRTAASIRLTVAALGASDTAGLAAERAYPVRLVAEDSAGVRMAAELAIWIDASTASADGDGQCP